MTANKNYTYTFLIPSLRPGGAERNCIRLANKFHERGINVEIWLRERSPNDLGDLLNNNIKIITIGGTGLFSTSLKLLRHLLIKTRSASYLVFNYNLLAPLLIYKLVFNPTSRVTFRIISSLPNLISEEKNFFKRTISKIIVKIIAPFSDQIITQCESMKIEASRYMGISSSRFHTIYNPIELRNAPPLKERKHQILYVGRFIQLKGINYLLKAFKKVSEQDTNITLCLLGNGPQLNELKTLAKKLELTDKVTFAGFHSNTSPFYSESKLTVLTSMYEGFPNVLVESIAHGTPVVSFDCNNGPAEIIIDRINGFLVELRNVDELAEKICKVLHEVPFDSIRVSETAKKFDINLITTKYFDLMSRPG